MRLSQHFDLSEFVKSETAETLGIVNEPGTIELQNLVDLCHEVLEPVRAIVATAVTISSGYRCEELNKRVGGAHGSQHVKGQAADIRVPGMTPKEVFEQIGNSIAFDQCILEPTWVHISWAPMPRRERRIRTVVDGKVVYPLA